MYLLLCKFTPFTSFIFKYKKHYFISSKIYLFLFYHTIINLSISFSIHSFISITLDATSLSCLHSDYQKQLYFFILLSMTIFFTYNTQRVFDISSFLINTLPCILYRTYSFYTTWFQIFYFSYKMFYEKILVSKFIKSYQNYHFY